MDYFTTLELYIHWCRAIREESLVQVHLNRRGRRKQTAVRSIPNRVMKPYFNRSDSPRRASLRIWWLSEVKNASCS